ncbi:AAA family ATPase [Alkalihalobacillus sp. MEB130]|uniref:AAA family ATPase n=1 Tax=Alkalihalobacillus sp. MEB130 TaxID=2976704 RepID=UPI0028DFFD73|nr:AAA family ATPase [Alkalihalobacillus sp. MEB130]MDT8860231.1 AAA family ATPase [Alkalihalobacillus sp. MEB130]
MNFIKLDKAGGTVKRIYIISGPAGVGKSTTSRRLAELFEHSAYIEGDLLNHMVIGGYLPPWESEESLSLVWDNIADLSINFAKANHHVIIDYVAFPEEIEKLSQKIYAEVSEIEVIYVVLWVDKAELLKRDALRIKEHQMGERCLELAQEFESKGIEKRFVLDTTNLKQTDLDDILLEIRGNPRFRY